MANRKLPVSVIVPVLNEELNCRRVWRVRWADEAFVVDSGSRDKTVGSRQRRPVSQFLIG